MNINEAEIKSRMEEFNKSTTFKSGLARLCCYIPDLQKLDKRCQNLATYQIWYGSGPEDFTESCNEHLEIMLDDNISFTILRIPQAM